MKNGKLHVLNGKRRKKGKLVRCQKVFFCIAQEEKKNVGYNTRIRIQKVFAKLRFRVDICHLTIISTLHRREAKKRRRPKRIHQGEQNSFAEFVKLYGDLKSIYSTHLRLKA